MNYSGKIRILLDTTYILPIIGIDVEDIEKVIILLKKLRDKGVAEFYYTQFNILEIIGKLGRIDFDKDRVKLGLISIKEEFIEVKPSLKAWLKALELRRKGFRDIIDLLLYTTSLTNNILFLTRDIELIKFLEDIGEDTSTILPEEKFLYTYANI